MKLFFQYIKDRCKILGAFLLFTLVFLIVFNFNNVSEDLVGYAFAICSFMLSIIFIFDFYHYYRKHKLLTEMLDKVEFEIDDLRFSAGLPEKDYLNLIEKLYDCKNQIVSGNAIMQNEMIDYYTLWAHQIKTPISAMRLLLDSGEYGECSELKSELFKIEQYVEMVLQYLRLESDTTDFVLKRYALDSIIKQAVRKYAKLFILKKISLELDDIKENILTDEKWFVFVIEQILSNSLKYTNAGRIKIYCRVETLIIEDTGIGIAPEDLPRVFERGFTGYNGRNDKKSTGIGLFISKKILTKLGHDIEIESAVGQGTRVKINFAVKNIGIE